MGMLFPGFDGETTMPFWQRLLFHLDIELIDSLVLFWSAFFLFAGLAITRVTAKRSASPRSCNRNWYRHKCARCACSSIRTFFSHDERHLQLMRIDVAAGI